MVQRNVLRLWAAKDIHMRVCGQKFKVRAVSMILCCFQPHSAGHVLTEWNIKDYAW